LGSQNTVVGTVVAIGGGLAAVRIDGRECLAKIAGRLRLELRPVVGDVVDCLPSDDGTVRIDRVHERRTELLREQRLGRGDQVLVANADVLVVVAALADPPFRRGLVDRLLVAAWAGRMEAALVITKADRAEDAPEPASVLIADYQALGYGCVAIDARTSEGADVVRALIGSRTAAFMGHSGVGKSTLVNGLTGGAQATGIVNEVIRRGRHTTTTARLVEGKGISLVDTPGIRGFSLTGLDAVDLGDAFPEIAAISGSCRFRTCQHLGEPGCVVRDAVSPVRYDSYRKLLAELSGTVAAS
jgi:ribosome biogenesis GTPase